MRLCCSIGGVRAVSVHVWILTLNNILWDGGYFRVFAVQYVPNKNTDRYPCWEATTEPVFKDDHGEFVAHDRHVSVGKDGTRTLLKSSMVGFALAKYSNGDDADPIRLTFADTCIAKFLTRQARNSATPKPSAHKRPAQNAAPSARFSQREKRRYKNLNPATKAASKCGVAKRYRGRPPGPAGGLQPCVPS